MDDPTLDDLSRRTARDILKRHAPDCLDRQPLIQAIARLARLGLEGHVRLYQTQHVLRPAEAMPPRVEDNKERGTGS